MSEFEPAQLDQLEDALAALEDPRALSEIARELQLDPQVADRFDAYREISRLTAAHLVDEPVPVDAYTRAVTAAQVETTGVGVAAPLAPAPEPLATDVKGGWQRWWKRWRAGLIPLTALGGTAALVLLMVRPGPEPELARATPGEFEQAARPSPTMDASRGQGVEAKTAEEASDAAVEPEPELQADEARQLGELGSAGAAETKKAAPRARPAKEENIVGPGGYQEQPAIDREDPKGLLYERLETAHQLRRQGNCASAIVKYQGLLGQPDLDALQRSKAEAGLGLCREFMGDQKRSDGHYGKARQSDPTIDGWISRERTKTAPVSEKSSRKAKQKKRAAPQKAAPQATDSL